jgi:predicted TIM-barrel fold metal-dependent hydrolase
MTATVDWIVSVDDHVLEPRHVWERWLPERWKERAPRLVRNDDGEAWVFEGIARPTTGLVAVAGKSAEEFSPTAITYEEMRPGCYDPIARVADMDLDGVLASLCFPSFPRFCGQVFSECDDRELGFACLQAWNDWMVEEWCGSAPGRYIPLMLIPLWDPALAAREIDRCAAKGARAVAFSENPSHLGWPSIHDRGRYWDPVFAASQANEMPLCTHIGSSSRFPQSAPDAPPFVSFTVGPLSNAASCLGDWIFSGNLQRFPGLKVALSEGSIGWVPYLLERMDQVFEKQRHWASGGEFERDPWTGTLVRKSDVGRGDVDVVAPREIFRDHIYGCFFDDTHGLRSLDEIGVDNVMIETDYPHSDSTWPNSIAKARKVLGELDQHDATKIAMANACRVYRFQPAPPPRPSA